LKILSIIPARGGSKGIPLKNLTLLGKKPLIYHTIKASLNSKINRTIVSTDNLEISKIASKYGSEVILRPKKLSDDKSQIEPVIKYVLDYLIKKEKYVPDLVILLQNTSPLRTSKHIDKAIEFFNKNNFDSVLSGFIAHSLIWQVKNKTVKPINYNPLNRQNRQDMKNQFIENGAIYITKNKLFNKTNCRVSGKIGVFEMSEESSLQIDSTHDILFAEQILKMRIKK
jgi:CMP-N,N'-diacetyllegionaminic acid synthase